MTSHCCVAYTPEVNHDAIAGLWKLTQKKILPKSAILYPMKEFTVFPKDKELQKKIEAALIEDIVEHEMLLMLKEDGSFQQYADDERAGDEVTIPDKLKYHQADDAVLQRFFGRIQGKWAFVDGKLILAADRPENSAKIEDTLLVGKVVAKSEESLADNPLLKQENDDNQSREKEESSALDTHLSVPKGQVNVGKFMYPRHHPSFFELPMFEPTPKGNFELKQVLGSLNAQTVKREVLIEKFRTKDFHGKRFLLTSHPLGERRPKGNIRWSIKYNRYVGKSLKRQESKSSNVALK
jgi:hypothetical protein